MDEQEAIEKLKSVAPVGSTIISALRHNNGRGDWVIAFAVVTLNDQGQAKVIDLTNYAAIASNKQRKDTPQGEGIPMRGMNVDLAQYFVEGLGEMVWNDREAYKHYKM